MNKIMMGMFTVVLIIPFGTTQSFSQSQPESEPIPVLSTGTSKYPPIWLLTRAEGMIQVDVVIDAAGNVTTAGAVDGVILLRQPAEEAAKLWKFAPVSDPSLSRKARLTIVYRPKLLETTLPKTDFLFSPPYRLEIIAKIPTIAPLRRSEAPIDEARCPLHHDEAMKMGLATIIYGLLMADIQYPNDDLVNVIRNLKRKITHRQTYEEARGKLFPGSNLITYGGCMVGDEIKEEVLYCPRCRAIEAKWRKFYPDRSPALVALLSEGQP